MHPHKTLADSKAGKALAPGYSRYRFGREYTNSTCACLLLRILDHAARSWKVRGRGKGAGLRVKAVHVDVQHAAARHMHWQLCAIFDPVLAQLARAWGLASWSNVVVSASLLRPCAWPGSASSIAQVYPRSSPPHARGPMSPCHGLRGARNFLLAHLKTSFMTSFGSR